MVHLSITACLLGGLLGLFVLAPVLTAQTPNSMCTPLRTFNDNLSNRRRYMKHYFPLNYTLRVHQSEIFKLRHIRRLRLQVKDLKDVVLQTLWFRVNHEVLKRIVSVLPDKHPSRPYTAELEKRFRDLDGVFQSSQVSEETFPDEISEIFDRLADKVPETSWRLASPKSLLDNLYRTMHCLFSDCFPSQEGQDYCAVSYWWKGRKKDLQPKS